MYVHIHSINGNNLFWLELLISTPNDFVSLCSISNNSKEQKLPAAHCHKTSKTSYLLIQPGKEKSRGKRKTGNISFF